MNDIKLSSIAAMAENRVIGRDNALIWHIPEDLKHFKRTTMGKPIIMGRKSYEALGKPLPGRPNIVISRSGKMPEAKAPTAVYDAMESRAVAAAPETAENPSPAAVVPETEKNSPPAKPASSASRPPELHYVKSIEKGIAMARQIAGKLGVDEVFITGGGEIYRQTMDMIDRLYLTVIHREYEGDTTFPEFDWNDWTITHEDRHDGNPAFTFYTLERKIAGA